MIPPKLTQGDEIRVIAPSLSFAMIDQDCRAIAAQRFEDMGLTVSYGKNCEESDEFGSSSIDARLQDLHEAFADPKVKAIFPPIGGYNVNQLLPHVNYDHVRKNPKILCGYSDITALSLALYAKTGLVGYSGPCFSTLGMKKGFEYMVEYLQKCLMSDTPFSLQPSPKISDDVWFLDQENRNFDDNSGPYVITSGKAEGTIIGGNLGTMQLLHGTPYMPSLRDSILFLEECDEAGDKTVEYFDRDFHSLLQQPDFEGVRGMIFGRFNTSFGMTKEKLRKIMEIAQLDIPVIADADFGHQYPLATFPIGGRARIEAGNNIKIEILEH